MFDWNILQIIFVTIVCLMPVVGFGLVIYAFIAESRDDINRVKNSRYVFKGYSNDGVPIFLELPKKGK